LGERLLCKQEVVGSIPSGSTKSCWIRLVLGIGLALRNYLLLIDLDGNREVGFAP